MVRQRDHKGQLSLELGSVNLLVAAGVEVGEGEEAESALEVEDVDVVLATEIAVDKVLGSPVLTSLTVCHPFRPVHFLISA